MQAYRRRVNGVWPYGVLLCLAICLVAASRSEAQEIVINEFMAANNETIADPQGQYDDWVELFNASDRPVDLGGWYLTDDLTQPTRWRFPVDRPELTTIAAGGFLMIWTDGDGADPGLHASFGLSSAGESLGLYDADGETLIDSIEFQQQTADLSTGRLPDGAASWHLLATPTPDASNEEAYEGITAPVTFSVTRGFYEGSVTVALETETEGATIYYTLDGGHPLEDAFGQTGTGARRGVTQPGFAYEAPLVINKTTCLRATAIKPDWQNAPVVTHTYLFLQDVIRQSPQGQAPGPQWPSGSVNGQRIDYGMDPDIVNDPRYANRMVDAFKAIPTLSLVTDLANLFDPSRGIYVHAQSDGRNWERPVSVELIYPNGTPGFQIDAGLRIRGGFSRTGSNPKHAFRLLFRSEYGASRLRYPLFEDEGVDEFENVDLRTSQNYSWSFQGDSHNTFVREVFSRDLQGQMGHPYTRSRYYHLYLNGQYWGLFQTQERAEASHAATYLGGEPEDYDVIKTNNRLMVATDGNRDAFRQLYDLTLQGFSDPAVYLRAQGLNPDGSANPDYPKLLDVDNLIDYMLIEYFTGDRDGPGSRYGNVPNNTFSAYNRVHPDGFKWFQHDSEHSLGTGEFNLVQPFTTAGSQFQYFNPHWLHEQLAQNNEEYRMRFADRVHEHLFHGVMTVAANQERLRTRASQIEMAIIAESARWGDAIRTQPFTKEDWQREVTSIIEGYLPTRGSQVLDQFRSVTWYPDVDAPVFYINGTEQNGGRLDEGSRLEIRSPGPQAVVYFSLDGEDPRIAGLPGQNFETIVAFDAEKRVLVPSAPVPTAWQGQAGFDDAAWQSGAGHVGFDLAWTSPFAFGLDVEEAMWNRNASCYVRIPLTLKGDPSTFQTLTLNVWYDDGFIAYLNGTLILSVNAPADPTWNSHATHAHEAAAEPEVFDISTHRHLLRTGDNVLSLHGLNATASSPDFLVSATLDGIEVDAAETLVYNEPIPLTRSVHVQARTWRGDSWSALNQAVYVVGAFEGLRVSEIMYHHVPGPEGVYSDIEYVELVNAGDSAVDLNRVRFSRGIDFTFPRVTLAPGAYTLVVAEGQPITDLYGPDLPIAGVYAGRLSNSGERLVLEDPAGEVLADIRFSDGSHPQDFTDGVDAWPTDADGQGMALSLRSFDSDGSRVEDWQALPPSPGRGNDL